MPRIKRILCETDGWQPGEVVTYKDVATEAVVSTVVADANGNATIPLAYAIILRAIAQGLAGGVASLVPGAQSGGAGGDAEASGTLRSAQPLVGAGGGQAGGAGGLAPSSPIAGAAGGQAGGAGAVSLSGGGNFSGPAGGDAEGSGTLSQEVKLAGQAQGQAGAGPSVLAHPVALSGSTAGQAAGSGSATVQSGGGGIGNGGFESALAGSLVEGNWYARTLHVSGDGGETLVAERSSVSPIVGVYRGRLVSTGFDDGEMYGAGSSFLEQKIAKSQLTTTPTLSFKARNDGGGTAAGVAVAVVVTPLDAGGTPIADTTNDKNRLKLWGAAHLSAINTSIAVTPSGSTVYDRAFNLNTFAEGCLVAGRTAADIAHVVVGFACWATTTGHATLSVDEVGLS